MDLIDLSYLLDYLGCKMFFFVNLDSYHMSDTFHLIIKVFIILKRLNKSSYHIISNQVLCLGLGTKHLNSPIFYKSNFFIELLPKAL